MRPRTVLILVVLTGVLGLLLWLFERDLPSSDERAERAKRVLTSSAEAVRAIEIQRGTSLVRLEREEEARGGEEEEEKEETPSRWRLTQPLDARADAGKVEALLSRLVELERKRSLDGVDLSDVGLDEERGAITVTGIDRATTIRIGAEVPASPELVVELDGSDVVVVPDGFWTQADVAAEEWRSRQIVPFPAADIERVEIRGAGGPLVVERKSGRFVLRQPAIDDADEDRARELLQEIAALSVREFVDEDSSVAGLEQEGLTTELALGVSGRPDIWAVRLEVPEEGQDVRGEVEGFGFLATTKLFELLAADPTDWQSKAWTETEVFNVEGIEITAEGETSTLLRSGGDWQRDGEAISYALVSDLLYAIVDLRGEGVEPVSPVGGPTAVEIVLTTKAGGERLSLVARDGADFLALRSGRAYSPVVSAGAVESLTSKLNALRSAEPLPATNANS